MTVSKTGAEDFSDGELATVIGSNGLTNPKL